MVDMAGFRSKETWQMEPLQISPFFLFGIRFLPFQGMVRVAFHTHMRAQECPVGYLSIWLQEININ